MVLLHYTCTSTKHSLISMCAQMHLHLQVQMQMRHLHLHLIALWWMHLHLHLHLIHPHLHLHLIQMHLIGIKCETNAKQMGNKCESNETVLLLHNVYFLSWFRLEYVSGGSVQKPLIAVSESHSESSAHKDRSKPMGEWLSCLDCQGR